MLLKSALLSVLWAASMGIPCAWADEDISTADSESNPVAVSQDGDVGADASRADKRLPPVFPGEEISDGQNKIKVWSTTGQVSTGQVPQAPNLNPNEQVRIDGVVVDGRDFDRRRR